MSFTYIKAAFYPSSNLEPTCSLPIHTIPSSLFYNVKIPNVNIIEERGLKVPWSQRIREFDVRLCLLIAEAAPINSQPRDCPNMSLTRRTPVNTSNCVKKVSKSRTSQCCKRHHRQLRAAEKESSGLPQGRSHELLLQGQTVLKTYIHTCHVI